MRATSTVSIINLVSSFKGPLFLSKLLIIIVNTIPYMAAILSIVLLLGQNDKLFAAASNADALYLNVLFENLSNGGRIVDWHLTPAPYFFPDYLVFSLPFILFEETSLRITSNAVMQILLVALAFGWVLRNAGFENSFRLGGIAGLTLTLLSLFAGGPWVYSMISAHHFGVILTGLLILPFLMKHLSLGKAFSINGLAVFLLAGFIGLSDKISVPQIILPLTVAILVWKLLSKSLNVSALIAALLPFCGALVGMLSYPIIVSFDKSAHTKVTISFAQLETYLTHLPEQPLFLHMSVFFLVIACLCLVASHILFSPKIRDDFKILLVFFFCYSVIGNVASMFLLDGIALSSRYFIPAFVFPILMPLILIGSFAYISNIFLIGLITITLISLTSFQNAQSNSTMDLHLADIACIDRHIYGRKFKKGASSYWDAKEFQSYTRHDITVAQYTPNLEKYKWITANSFYSTTYDFVIVSDRRGIDYRLDIKAIRTRNECILKSQQCHTLTLLTCENGDRLKLDP